MSTTKKSVRLVSFGARKSFCIAQLVESHGFPDICYLFLFYVASAFFELAHALGGETALRKCGVCCGFVL